MTFPESVTSASVIKPLENQYFYKAFAAMNRLSDIRSGVVKYYSDDYSLLINTLERLYKGFLQSKIDSGKVKLPPGFLTLDHDLCKLVREIERFTPLFVINSIDDAKNRDTFLRNLRKAYTTARYSCDFPFEEFCRLYDFVEKQRAVIEHHLQPEKKNYTEEMELDL